MCLTLKEELQRAFELATLRREAKDLRTPRQWAQAQELMIRAKTVRERETRLFSECYDMRVEVARRRLIDSAGAPARTFQPNWISRDRFDAADLLRQAQREVRSRHEGRLIKIDEAEAQLLAGIVRRASRENTLNGAASAAFERATDRRQVTDRRRRTGPS